MSFLFLYDHPWSVPQSNSKSYLQDMFIDYFDEQDRKDEERLRDYFLKFILENELAETDGDVIKITTTTDRGSWAWHTTWMSMRALVVPESFNKLIQALEALDSNPLNLIIDFHNRLGILFNHRFLNTLVNRTIQSTMMIPIGHGVSNITTYNDQIALWHELHKDYPFLWILIYAQCIIRSQVPIPKL